jgi:IPT/TIG domain-containing protein
MPSRLPFYRPHLTKRDVRLPAPRRGQWILVAGIALTTAVILVHPAGAQQSGQPSSVAQPAASGDREARLGPAAQTVSDGGTTSESDNAVSDKRRNEKKEQPEPYRTPRLLALYVILLVLFPLVLHLVDSFQAYELSKRTCKDLLLGKLGKLDSAVSPDQAMRLARDLTELAKPTGIAGTTRSIFTYTLLLVLGISVFHLLAVGNVDAADKILTILAGAVSSIIGFYFGSQAAKEGVDSKDPQPRETSKPPPGSIIRVDPPQATTRVPVTIQGSGFGAKKGGVQFGSITAVDVSEWDETHIKVNVPDKCIQGKTAITVNPAHEREIVGSDTLFEIIESKHA